MKHVALADVCTVIMGQAPDGETYNEVGNGLPLLAGAGDFDNETPRPKKYTTARNVRTSEPGDVVIGIRASIGDKVLADNVYCLGRGVAGLRAGPHVEPRFLWHWVTHAAPTLASKGRGATFLQVNKNDIAELEIPLPPIDEQRRIAFILDAANVLRNRRRRALEKLDSLTQASFVEMFGDVGSRDCEWMTAPLSDVVSRPLRNGAYFEPNAYRPEGEGVEMVHMSDAFNGVVKPGSLKQVAATARDLATYRLTSQDLLIARRSLNLEGAAKPCLVSDGGKDLIFESSLIRVSPEASKVTVRYLFGLLSNRRYRAHCILPVVTGATISGISQANLAKIPIPLPPLALQQQFDDLMTFVEAHRERMALQLLVLDGLFGSLEHRAFRGEL